MYSGKKLAIRTLPILCCLLALLLAACGGTPATTTTTGKAPADKQILRYTMLDSDISTFDPALSQDTASDFAIKAAFTGLVELDTNLKVVDQLAASHTISADGLTYTFKLRDGLKFSDGTPLTSKDVAYSINRTLLPATKSQVTSYLGLLKDSDKILAGKIPTLIGDSIVIPDAQTVELIISKPASYFLSTLTYDCSYVVEQSLIDKYGVKWTDHLQEGGGDGPFKVSSYSHTKGIEFVPNANYYGPKPQLQKLEYVQAGDYETSYKAYEANQLDYTYVPPTQLATLRSSKEFHEYPLTVTSYLALNYLVKPFDNIHVREAFALAINKDLLATTILKNSVKASWNFIPPGSPGANSSIVGPAGSTSQAGDPTKAQALFKQGITEEGYANVAALPPLKLSFYAPSITTKNWIAAIIEEWQTVLGVSVKTETMDFPKLISLENASQNNSKGLQIWRAGWSADYPDPQDWLSIFFSKGGNDNLFNYGQNSSTAAAAQQAVQDELIKADVEQNQATRFSMYNDAEQKIVSDVGVIPLWQLLEQIMIKSKVQGFPLNSLNIVPPDAWSSVYISQ